MRRAMTATFSLILLTLMVSSGCGQKAEGDKTKGEPVETKMEVTASVNDTTGANKTYPIRDVKNKIVTLETNHGKLIMELYRDVAPAHADSFVARSSEGFYDSTIFHRIIDNFMIQGGDPQGTGMGNAGYTLPAEFSDLPHVEGTLSAARGPNPNSASSQFFICLARNRSTESLDGQYTVFGHLLKGYDVLHSIGSTAVRANPYNPNEISVPVEEVKLIKAYVSDANGNPL